MIATWKPGMTIDRINVNGNYEPSNCRWITQAEQTKNTRRNVMIDMPDGTQLVAIDAAKILEVPYQTLIQRYRRGLRGEELIYKGKYARWK